MTTVPRNDRRLRVLLVASVGGHLTQLKLLTPAFADAERIWVTFDHANVDLGDDEVVFCHSPTTRNVPNLLRNLVLAWKLLRSRRPDLVVSTGAGAAVPFFSLARLVGARTIFIEVYDRIDTATMTGRLVKPFADRFLVQWPEQQSVYGDSDVVGTVYNALEPHVSGVRPDGTGDRVFVTVGTDHHPFDRLVEWSDELARSRPDLDVFVQRGTTGRGVEFAQAQDYLDGADLAERLGSADAVVCHGGPSTILEAIAAGHRPVVVPRDPGRGEHIDDHQQRFTRHLAARDVIDLVETADGFAEAVDAALQRARRKPMPVAAPAATIEALRAISEDLVGTTP